MKLKIFAAIVAIAALASCNKNRDNIYQFQVVSNKGEQVALDQYKGKVIMVVNTASKCGFTPQYDGLEALYKKYQDKGLVILGFPCDQFGHQEPGSNEEIEEFCRLNHGVTFPLMSKIEVNGEGADPLYKWLYSKKPFESFGEGQTAEMMTRMLSGQDPDFASNPNIKWNFTKFLVDRKGNVVARFEPTVTPEQMEEAIEACLK